MNGLLTEEEQAVVRELGQCWNRLCRIVGNGPTRSADLNEVVFHVHALQNFVMAQAAARAYPDTYRLAGETMGCNHDGS